MAPFFPIYVRRSDGKAAIVKSLNSKETNEPLPEQLDQTPNAQGVCDFYRECHPGESKEVDWRRKLAGMLMREIGGAQHKDKNFILAALPENYRLFEHVRSKVSDADGKTQKPTKNHAAGGNERQDAYLYGYPQGRKKRYRSPAEFFPHLLWLSTDEQGDPNNCSCKFCSPEELESDDKPKLQAKDAKQQQQQTTISEPQSKPTVRVAAGEQRPPSNPASQSLTPSPLPRFRRNEQKLDAQFNQFLYRPGELIWFQRSSAWGLGVVQQRDVDSAQRCQYRVQPLSHPLAHPQTLICSQSQVRAWLSWSPPPCICAELNPNPSNNNRVHTYDTVDWPAYLQDRYGPGDAEVDGSILAAKYIESTYALFDIIDSKTSSKGSGQTSEISYSGMFLGAEKIWLGEPLRIRNSANPNDMMVLQTIIERQNPVDPTRSELTLIGDIYSQRIAQFETAAVPQSKDHLPSRVQGELEARNAIASRSPDPSRRLTYFWKLETKSAQLSISDIKGRWYESSLLMPALARAEYEAELQRGELGDAGMWMNGHGDCNKPPNAPHGAFRPADLKVKRREDAFARAVPLSFKISKGLDDSKATASASAPTQATTNVKVERPSHTPQSVPQLQLQPSSQHPAGQTDQSQRSQQQFQQPPPSQPLQRQPQATPQATQDPQREQQQHLQQQQQFQYNHNPNVPNHELQHHSYHQQHVPDANFDQYMDFTADGHADGLQQDPNLFSAYGGQQYEQQFESEFFREDGMGH